MVSFYTYIYIFPENSRKPEFSDMSRMHRKRPQWYETLRFLKLYVLPLRKKVADFYYSLLIFSYIPHFQKIQQNHNLSKSVTEVINTA